MGSSMNNETLEAMMKMIDNILLKRLSSSTVSALAISYLLFKVKVTFSKLLEMIVGIIQTLHSDLNEFETAFAKFQLCMNFF